MATVPPASADFSGFVFKLQANTDPKHRDRIAFVRVCSGRFEKGLRVKHSRLRGKEMTLSQAQSLMGQARHTLEAEISQRSRRDLAEISPRSRRRSRRDLAEIWSGDTLGRAAHA